MELLAHQALTLHESTHFYTASNIQVMEYYVTGTEALKFFEKFLKIIAMDSIKLPILFNAFQSYHFLTI